MVERKPTIISSASRKKVLSALRRAKRSFEIIEVIVFFFFFSPWSVKIETVIIVIIKKNFDIFMNAKWKLPEISHYFWSYYHLNASDLFAGTGTGVVFPELSPFLREADDMTLRMLSCQTDRRTGPVLLSFFILLLLLLSKVQTGQHVWHK